MRPARTMRRTTRQVCRAIGPEGPSGACASSSCVAAARALNSPAKARNTVRKLRRPEPVRRNRALLDRGRSHFRSAVTFCSRSLWGVAALGRYGGRSPAVHCPFACLPARVTAPVERKLRRHSPDTDEMLPIGRADGPKFLADARIGCRSFPESHGGRACDAPGFTLRRNR